MNSLLSGSEDPHILRVQQLFMVHQQAILAYLLSLVPKLDDAQDLLQDVFLVVSRKAETWAEGTNFMAWVCAIARYEALHYARSNRRQMIPLDADVLELLQIEKSLSVELMDNQIDLLRDCLQQLAPRARELVLLRYHSSQMPEQIARSLHWSVGAVRVALTRAKQSLRDCLNQKLLNEEL